MSVSQEPFPADPYEHYLAMKEGVFRLLGVDSSFFKQIFVTTSSSSVIVNDHTASAAIVNHQPSSNKRQLGKLEHEQDIVMQPQLKIPRVLEKPYITEVEESSTSKQLDKSKRREWSSAKNLSFLAMAQESDSYDEE